MPATARRNASQSWVQGVDGCRGGWIVARFDLETRRLETVFGADFGALFRSTPAAMTLVDMPIGLAEAGGRWCESAARRLLGPRRSSVFSAPRRPMLAFDRYEDANAWGKADGAGLSKQAWNITPKIAEIDRAITPADQARLGEGHPEVAFARLGGGPCAHPKRIAAGLDERRVILQSCGLAIGDAMIAEARMQSSGAAKADDVLDACALALTAEARLRGTALRLSDEARDARGFVMEIWG